MWRILSCTIWSFPSSPMNLMFPSIFRLAKNLASSSSSLGSYPLSKVMLALDLKRRGKEHFEINRNDDKTSFVTWLGHKYLNQPVFEFFFTLVEQVELENGYVSVRIHGRFFVQSLAQLCVHRRVLWLNQSFFEYLKEMLTFSVTTSLKNRTR